MTEKTNVEICSERLKQVVDGFNMMKSAGLDEELLICYLRIKTRMSERDIKGILAFQEEFVNKLMAKDMFKELKEDD